MVSIRTTGVLAALLAVVACAPQNRNSGEGEQELVLRSYEVPGEAEALQEAIGRLLQLERPAGSVQAAPNGQLLVLAPRSIQDGVADLIAALPDTGEGAFPSSVVTTYWLIAAQPREKETERSGELREIETVLDEIQGAQGPQEFRLIDRVELRQAGGVHSVGEALTPKVKIQQSLSVTKETIVAHVEGDLIGPNRIETDINLRAGQILVLGQQALDTSLDPFFGPAGPPRGRDALAWQSRPPRTFLYLILRAQIDRAS